MILPAQSIGNKFTNGNMETRSRTLMKSHNKANYFFNVSEREKNIKLEDGA